MSYTQFGEISLTTEMMTAAEVNSAIATAQTGAYDLKGSETVANLNTLSAGTTLVKGATYNVSDGGTLNKLESASTSGTVLAGDNVFWTGTYWDKLTGTINLSGYVQTTRKVNGHALNADVTVTASDIGVESGAQVNTVEGVKLSGASAALTPDSTTKIVTIPNAVATGLTGATNGLMTADDKKKLTELQKSINVVSADSGSYYDFTSGNANWLNIKGSGPVSTAMSDNSVVISVAAAAPSTNGEGGNAGTMSAADKKKLNGIATGAQTNVIEGVKLAGASGNLTPSSKVVTIPNAVATGETGATNGLMTASDKKNLGDVTGAAGTLYSALNTLTATGAALNADTMTNVNAIKTALVTLIGYLKQFAAAADGNSSTSYSV